MSAMPTTSRRHAAGRRLLAASAVFFAITCSGLDNIDIPIEAQTVVPEGTVVDQLLGQLSFAGFEGFDIAQSQEFQNQGYTRDEIDSVRIISFTLSVVSPSSGDFDFLDRIAFFAESDGLPRVQIAMLDPVPAGQDFIELEVDSSVELADYASADSMTITTEATGTRPDMETTVAAEVILDVDVNVDGAIGCRVATASSSSR